MTLSNNIKITVFFFSILLLSATASAQKPDEILSKAKSTFPGEKAAFLEKREEINISYKNGEFEINAYNYMDKIMLTSNTQAYADHSIHFNNTFSAIKDIEAQVLRPGKRRYSKDDVENISTKSNLSGNIFFDDQKYKQIKYPKVTEGTRAIIEYTEETKDPHFLGGFYFKSYMPIMKGVFSVTFPDEVKLNYKIFNDPENKIKFTESSSWGKTTYKWETENMESYRDPENAPSITYYEPHVAIYISHYADSDETHTILSGVKDLFDWYDGMVTGVNQEKDDALKNITDSLVKSVSDKKEKVRKIFYWVQDNIRYVAFEDGLGGFVPREAAAVCSKRYGDCKDMSSIITTMLEYAGIESYLTWIGSRDIPYTYTELPTPMVDNHMIASVLLEGEYVFLDATGSYVPLGLPTSFIQGKEALIRKAPGEYQIEKVKIVPAAENSYTDSSYVKLDGPHLSANGYANYTGLYKFEVSHRLIGRSKSKREELLKKFMEKGHNKFLINDFSFSGLHDRDSSLSITYDYTLDDYISKAGDNLYVNLNLDRSFRDSKLDIEKREGISYELDYRNTEEHISVLEIPEGYAVDYIPEKATFEHPEFNFTITYEEKDNTIIQRKKVTINTLYIKEPAFEMWNNMINNLNEAYNEVIVLTKPKEQ